ncbi:MAG: hemolysin family protein [Bosea sp. (in: a-proteobacteria)]|uniref:hemolysin family protein n=1 Tax=Bosea sp. (in: a-proteobacteria) TaxID=1871050 RepID=UPI0027343A8D|nr:hemolysin family protein [Bosea sp. (in: a-proteobacteria)]MDP3258796.1 hemolysin family protein [Bosea sp. (in: a-proteobacteria)]MDP3320406.1 hemolysin family protein [Bosea sp. (in: a-proteobacteria)]
MSDDSRQTQHEAAGRGLTHWLSHFLDRLGLRGGGTIREEITDALAQGSGQLADLSAQERAMLSNVLSLRERRVGDVMIPRADIIAVPADATLDEVLARFRTAGHSRLPVFDDSLDDPRGMVHIRDFLEFIAGQARAEPTAGLSEPAFHDLAAVDLTRTLADTKIMRPVLYVPPSMPAVDLLVRMQATRTHIALVIDEYGGTDGLVTIEDLIEIVVGDIEDEHDLEEAPTIAPDGNGRFTADARATLDELKEATGIDLSDDPVAEDVDTLGGLIVTLAGHVPASGEIVEGPGGLTFEILEADQRRVKRLSIVQRVSGESGDRAAEAS